MEGAAVSEGAALKAPPYQMHLPLHVYDIGLIFFLTFLFLFIWYRLRSDFERHLVRQDWKENMMYLVTIRPPPEWVRSEGEGAERGVFCPDARCLAAEAFIRISGAEYEMVPSQQARGQSPTHSLPVLERNGEQFSDLMAIFETIASATPGEKGELLKKQLADRDSERMLLYSFLDTNLYFSIERQRWDFPQNYPVVVQRLLHWTPAVVRTYGGYLLRRNSMRTCWAHGVMRQRSVGRFQRSTEDQLGNIERMLERLTDIRRVRDEGADGECQHMQRWLDGSSPGATDCVLYGHLRQIIDDPLPTSLIRDPMANPNPNCHAFVKAMYRHLDRFYYLPQQQRQN